MAYLNLIPLFCSGLPYLTMFLLLLGISGLIGIWADVLPALGIFDKVVLWYHTGVVDGSEKLLPITLWDLIFAVLVAIITFSGAKRFPAIVEILLLQYTRVSSGDRYTITTLINYTIVGVGLFSVFNIMGARKMMDFQMISQQRVRSIFLVIR